jgi:hypothetical protein
MHGGVGIWRSEIVWRPNMQAPILPVRRGLAFIPRSFEQALVTIYRRVIALLTETAAHSESSVNHSKQTSAPFLPGSRIGTTHPIRGGVSSPLFARSI